jgi:hypothetical protein
MLHSICISNSQPRVCRRHFKNLHASPTSPDAALTPILIKCSATDQRSTGSKPSNLAVSQGTCQALPPASGDLCTGERRKQELFRKFESFSSVPSPPCERRGGKGRSRETLLQLPSREAYHLKPVFYHAFQFQRYPLELCIPCLLFSFSISLPRPSKWREKDEMNLQTISAEERGAVENGRCCRSNGLSSRYSFVKYKIDLQKPSSYGLLQDQSNPIQFRCCTFSYMQANPR